MDGILNINKPFGKTSFSVVSLVKRLSGERRVGHAGTLDPAAIGVLPVCLGQATRVVEYFHDATKTYRAEVALGITTDTYDAAGQVTGQCDASRVTREQVESALAPFRGLIQQTPPMFSAVRHKGQKLYTLARAGVEVERKSRPAQIFRLELTGWQPPSATLEVECGKGTYIRSLAHDIGQALGCGASLKGLTRLRCGPFDIEHAVSLEGLQEVFGSGRWERLLYPIDTVLLDWKTILVSDAGEVAIRQGKPLAAKESEETLAEGRCRAYTLDGRFLAVLSLNRETMQWKPEKVFGRAGIIDCRRCK